MTQAANLAAVGTNANSGGTLITSGTAITLTNQTAPEFTGIPSWVKRITVMFDGVSTSGTSSVVLQIGDSGGVETSGYLGEATTFTTVISHTAASASFPLEVTAAGATSLRYGAVTLSLLNSSTNTWVISGTLAITTGTTAGVIVSGSKSLSATLDRVRITTANGTDTFDAGTVNIFWE